MGARGNIATKDEEKVEVLNAFFASVFNSHTGYSQGSQPPVLEDREGDQNKPHVIQDKAVKNMEMWHSGMWFSRHGGVGFTVRLDDLRSLFQLVILVCMI